MSQENNNVKIKTIEVANLMAIRDAKVDFTEGDIFIVRGANGKGKTTLGESLFNFLQGKFPQKPLRDGEKIGFFKATLDDGTVIKYNFDTETQSLTLHDATGKKISDVNSRAIINRLLGSTKKHFDMDAFLRETAPAKQKATIQQLAGIDLSAYDLAVKTAFESRAEANRMVKFQQPRVADYNPAMADREMVNVDDLLAKQKAMRELNQKRNDIEQEGKTAAAVLDAKTKAVESTDLQIADLEKQIAALKAKRNDQVAEQLAAENNVKALRQQWADAPAADQEEMNAIERQLANASTVNAEIQKHIDLRKDFVLLEQYRKDAAKAEKELQDAEAAKMKAIKEAQLPGGLSFDPESDGLLLNGYPLSQSCSADRAICALQIKVQELGDLGFIAFDASLLDFQNLEKVVEWLRANDLQAFAEQVARDKHELDLTVTVY